MFDLSFITGAKGVLVLLGELWVVRTVGRHGRGFLLLYRRLSSSGTNIMLRHITLPRPEWMALKMKPLR